MIRLNKFLALCGLGSRRKVENLISSGQITINGKKISTLGITIDPDNDIVLYAEKRIKPVESFCYIILNKPKGLLTTVNDDRGRPIVMDIIPEKYKSVGVFPVGRLDKDTEGLLLFTNDGELANRLSRPENKVPKEYEVVLDRPLIDEDKAKIEKGMFIHQIKSKTKPARVVILDKSGKVIKIVLSEGKKRQIRYALKNLDYKVKKLTRTSYGPIKLKGLNKGSHRLLKSWEIKTLKGQLAQD